VQLGVWHTHVGAYKMPQIFYETGYMAMLINYDSSVMN
jgi:hypothetical protein